MISVLPKLKKGLDLQTFKISQSLDDNRMRMRSDQGISFVNVYVQRETRWLIFDRCYYPDTEISSKNVVYVVLEVD